MARQTGHDDRCGDGSVVVMQALVTSDRVRVYSHLS